LRNRLVFKGRNWKASDVRLLPSGALRRPVCSDIEAARRSFDKLRFVNDAIIIDVADFMATSTEGFPRRLIDARPKAACRA